MSKLFLVQKTMVVSKCNHVMKAVFSAFLILALMNTSVFTAYGQIEENSTQDFLMIEVLFSMQGAVIGGGLGVFAMNQVYESFIEDCNLAGIDNQNTCLASQEIFSLCAGYAIGLPAGATMGLLASEVLFGVQGNILYALFGSMLGELAGVPQCSLISFLRQLGFSLSFNPPRDSDLSLILNPFMLSALGAVIGYNFDWLISGGFLEKGSEINVQLFEFRF